ncbi:MAG: branched-chain amino acid transaminase [bacterium]|nr:branched-chain amino acid transaminase [bacterium]
MNAKYIWHNGELIEWEKATVHVTTHAIHYGSSVFEGIRAYATDDGPAVFRLHDHTKRLTVGSKIAKIDQPYSAEQLDEAITELIRMNEHQSCYVRPVVFRGAGALGLEGRGRTPVEVYILTLDWGRYLGSEAIEKGVDAQVSSWRRGAPDSTASMAKIGGQYVNSMFISMEAHDNGYAEGIALDIHGYVSEGAGENIFVVYNNVVYTPSIWSSILAGITRDTVITLLKEAGYEIRYEPIAREMLYMADEIFFTGTAAEITPLRSIDKLPVGDGKRGKVTKLVQDQFFGITSGKLADKHGWLTYVHQKTPVGD